MSAFTGMLGALFDDDNIASDAVWTPQGGAATAVRAVPNREDVFSPFGETTIQSRKQVFDVRQSEAASMAAGDGFTFSATAMTIKHVRCDDPERLLWTIECY